MQKDMAVAAAVVRWLLPVLRFNVFIPLNRATGKLYQFFMNARKGSDRVYRSVDEATRRLLGGEGWVEGLSPLYWPRLRSQGPRSPQSPTPPGPGCRRTVLRAMTRSSRTAPRWSGRPFPIGCSLYILRANQGTRARPMPGRGEISKGGGV